MRKTAVQFPAAVAACVEALEPRQLLSDVAWGQQAIQIGQDLAAQNYPQINGSGETIAVIDTGIDYHHPVLGAGIGNGLKVVDGYDFMTNTPDPAPKDGIIPHGTASAGLAAGYGWNFDNHYFQGVAPAAQIVALRGYQASVAPALDWVIAHRQQYNIVAVQVLGPDATIDQSQINTLVSQGVFIGTSGGNGGAAKPIPKLAGVVRTGSVDPSNQLSWFTQRGARLAMLAPGEHVALPFESQDGQQIELYSDGTSWSSPQVVGAAALIKQINPAFNEAQVLSILQDSGTKIFDPASGLTYPELNINSALALAITRSQPPAPLAPPPAKHHHHPAPTSTPAKHHHKPTPAPAPATKHHHTTVATKSKAPSTTAVIATAYLDGTGGATFSAAPIEKKSAAGDVLS